MMVKSGTDETGDIGNALVQIGVNRVAHLDGAHQVLAGEGQSRITMVLGDGNINQYVCHKHILVYPPFLDIHSLGMGVLANLAPPSLPSDRRLAQLHPRSHFCGMHFERCRQMGCPITRTRRAPAARHSRDQFCHHFGVGGSSVFKCMIIGANVGFDDDIVAIFHEPLHAAKRLHRPAGDLGCVVTV